MSKKSYILNQLFFYNFFFFVSNFYLEVSNSRDKINRAAQYTPKLLGETSTNAKKGVFYFQNFSLSGQPNNKYYLFITGPSLTFFASNNNLLLNEKFIDHYYYILPIILDSCPQGSMLENKLGMVSCKMCDIGKFTMSMYDICKDCIKGGDCVNGVIHPKLGYLFN